MTDATHPTSPLDHYVRELQRIKAEGTRLQSLDWTPPELVEPEPTHDDYRLKPVTTTSLQPLPEPISLETLRQELPVVLQDYLTGTPTGRAQLIKIPPGVGKTHHAVQVVQDLARDGLRGLWAAGRHNMFDDLANFQHFNPALWYHWRSIQGQDAGGDYVCRYREVQAKWQQRGYEGMDLCLSLCGHRKDNWIKQCPYRLQDRRKEPLIFGQHQHLTAGLGISDFDFIVIDELPLGAFIEERVIPLEGLDVGASGRLHTLTETLITTGAKAHKERRTSGRALFDIIGPLLEGVYEQVDAEIGVLPQVPYIFQPGQVDTVPYWYLFQFLALARAEYEAWRAGWPCWNERLWLTRRGLHLLQRAELWEKIPERVVVLDATAQPDLYRLILGRDVEAYAPVVERLGRVYQVAHRLNGKGDTLQVKELTVSGRELIEVTRALLRRSKAQRPGIVCWKAIAPHFRREFGEENVVTFGALRGTNQLQDVDVLIVAGTPTPDGGAMLDIASALSNQITPFWRYDADGKRIPLYQRADREYRLTPEALHAVKTRQLTELHHQPPSKREKKMALRKQWARAVGVARRTGYYTDPILDAIHRQLREAELIQALHRARVNIRPSIVWLLTSTPTEEPLDGVWNDPPLGPARIHWQVWLRLETWLETQWEQGQPITYASLADAAGVQETYARKNKWLDAIAAHLPEIWATGQLEPTGGRPKKNLVPLRGIPQKGGLLRTPVKKNLLINKSPQKSPPALEAEL